MGRKKGGRGGGGKHPDDWSDDDDDDDHDNEPKQQQKQKQKQKQPSQTIAHGGKKGGPSSSGRSKSKPTKSFCSILKKPNPKPYLANLDVDAKPKWWFLSFPHLM